MKSIAPVGSIIGIKTKNGTLFKGRISEKSRGYVTLDCCTWYMKRWKRWSKPPSTVIIRRRKIKEIYT